MERLLLERLAVHLDPLSDKHCRLRALASARALIANPDSSDSTRCFTIDALIRSLDAHSGDPAFLRPALKLLGEAAVLHRPLAPSVIAALRPFLNGGKSLAADAIAVLACIAESSPEGGGEGGVSLLASVLDEDLVFSLASSPVSLVRSRILNLLVASTGRAQSSVSFLRPHLMLKVLLGHALDLYPLVRRAALDGIMAFCEVAGCDLDGSIIDCCYDRAVELFRDEDELVRSAAVRVVSKCGQMFAASKERMGNTERMDVIFVQLCSMARDMSVKVRIEAFLALGKVQLVAENVLLQSLSKKVLGIRSGSKTITKCSINESKFSLSAAGAFVHGIEDEFYEVRTIACKSLGMLATFSIQFADNALNLLMDMLNDDAEAVRLQTLQTLFHMATHDRLVVQEKHMDMFLGLLADISAVIRCAARKVLQLMMLPDIKTFKSAVDCLITNLETYPEEEEDIFSVLCFIGKNHGNFFTKLAKEFAQEEEEDIFSVLCFIGKNHGNFFTKLAKEFAQELAPSCGELSLDSPRVAAIVVLFISSSISNEHLTYNIPVAIFSYAVSLVGRISCSLGNAINRDSLMAYLCHHSEIPFSDTMLESEVADEICHSWSLHSVISEVKVKENILSVDEIATHPEHSQKDVEQTDEELMRSIQSILEKVVETWPLIKSHCAHEVRRMLRTCKEELEMITWNVTGSPCALLEFASQYVQIIQLIAEIWEKLQPKKSRIVGTMTLEFLLEKLNMSLRRMRYGFPGLSREVECHIIQLTLLGFVFRLCKVGACSNIMLKKLQAIILRDEFPSVEGSSKLSGFAKELLRSCAKEGTAETSQPFSIYKLLELFNLEQVPFAGRFRCIKAELQVFGNDSENPLPFVSGLPVGITFQITVHNISNSDRLWLRMAVGVSIQYVFLDSCQFTGRSEVRKFAVNTPFYATPKVPSFLLRACILMECPSENVTDLKKDRSGPKDDIFLLGEEIDVYLVKIDYR
ncbi:protein SIEL [Cocos nucifera]|uniref:Protein SIEL n=1 Tax=Cocos nucifera TaxID=13894 RepID=A0A8K0IDY7_COCNU|nr:protein SIEL [Cocos nucifera]